MSVCVVYNPYNFKAKAIVVQIPSTANLYYALQIAKRERKINPMYTNIVCNVNVIGLPSEAKYVAFVKRMLKYMPIAISSDAKSLLDYYGVNVVIAPLETVVYRTVEEVLQSL